jgi:hypothetical protein
MKYILIVTIWFHSQSQGVVTKLEFNNPVDCARIETILSRDEKTTVDEPCKPIE